MSEINNLTIEGTPKTPEVRFDISSGELFLTGKSIPENSTKFYEPLLLWIEDYIHSPQQTTDLQLRLEYFNSSSTLWIARIIRTLSRIDLENSVLFIHLYFDEEDFESMDEDEMKELISSLINNVQDPKVNIGVKIHYVNTEGKTVSGSTVLFSKDKKYSIVGLML